jgi:lipopolysaccharide transport system ATP-binding protein
MTDPVIRVENLSKLYRLGKKDERAPTLIQALSRFASAPVRNFRKLRSLTHFEDAGSADDVLWALRDVSFEVAQGDVVGLIGRNGAGKSTLLKILSRIMPPSRGRVEIHGRLASLLEVGTGFHPELSGRDNIFLNGVTLGMTRREIARKFDEIVAFSEIEKFIDTPVKRYSSGMYVRLAFAVAAHLEPDILIVDEVLAVGDASFQKKCLGKMKDVSRGDGRTVLFVSHNMSAISGLCNQAIVMRQGVATGPLPVEEAIDAYLENAAQGLPALVWEGKTGDESLTMTRFAIHSRQNFVDVPSDHDFTVELCLEVHQPVNDAVVAIRLESLHGFLLAFSAQYDDADAAMPTDLAPGAHRFSVRIPANTLAQGTYRVVPDIGVFNRHRIVSSEAAIQFSVVNSNGLGRKFLAGSGLESIFRPQWTWTVS